MWTPKCGSHLGVTEASFKLPSIIFQLNSWRLCFTQKRRDIFDETEEVMRNASDIPVGMSEKDKPDSVHDFPPVTSDKISVTTHNDYPTLFWVKHFLY